LQAITAPLLRPSRTSRLPVILYETISRIKINPPSSHQERSARQANEEEIRERHGDCTTKNFFHSPKSRHWPDTLNPIWYS